MATSTSVLDGHSEEKLLRKLSAYRNYPPGVGRTSRFFPVRKVSAVRDYPPFCGPNALSLSKGDVSKRNGTEERKRKIDFLARGGGSKTAMMAKKSVNHSWMMLAKKKEGNASSGDQNTLPVPTSTSVLDGHSEERMLRKLSAYRNYLPGVGRTGRFFPVRRVSAVRDYPPFCGPNALSLSKGDVSKRNGTEERKRKFDFLARGGGCKTVMMAKKSVNHSWTMLVKKKEGNASSGGMDGKFSDAHRSYCYSINVPLLCRDNLSRGHSQTDVTRNTVREILRGFQAVCRKLLQEEEAKLKCKAKIGRRIDLEAAKILKYEGKYINSGKYIFGSVPGVEIGDEFDYRVELNLVGLHRNIQAGIDYAMRNGEHLATSIVASGGYNDELDNSGVLIYSGHGGNLMSKQKAPEDQKLERGNLALKNSIKKKNPVRVIRGAFFGGGSRRTFVYDGLYEVESYWQERGPHGKMIFKFQLRRIPNQPELPWIELKNSNMFTLGKGLCVADISNGKEALPIRAVNTIDNEKPPIFEYVTRMIYPSWLQPPPSKGCNCTDRCSDPTRCSCAVKNGGIPFNHTGCIVEVKPLVYECGPSCKCPPDCYNRVSQNGIKFPLEIYKTDKRGWGVRSLRSVPSGRFVCEYIGELLEDKEAEKRSGHDEYLFDIGGNLINNAVGSGGGFTIDAARFGNLGRFFNHSCAPNMYAQNVLYDHGNHRIPHIMLFAAENIPPLKELTFDYNYSKDKIFDSYGNLKKKNCYCGSVGCTGRMY